MSTDARRPRPPAPRAWGPLAALYLATLLIGLAAGLWPDAIFPPKSAPDTAALPTLRTVGVAQLGFVLLIYPMALYRRALAPGPDVHRDTGGSAKNVLTAPMPPVHSPGANWLGEAALLVVAAAPFYVLAAWFADATARDAVRTVLAVAAFWPLAWSAGVWARRGLPLWPATIGLLAAGVGLPMATYVVRDFLATRLPWQGLWLMTPAGLAWRSGAGRLEHWLPQPLWVPAAWITLGLAVAGLSMLLRPKQS